MVRYRCNACGNVTRFDVVASRRTRAFHHYSIAGDLTIEDEDVLEHRVEGVTCRWCSATGASIESIVTDAPANTSDVDSGHAAEGAARERA